MLHFLNVISSMPLLPLSLSHPPSSFLLPCRRKTAWRQLVHRSKKCTGLMALSRHRPCHLVLLPTHANHNFGFACQAIEDCSHKNVPADQHNLQRGKLQLVMNCTDRYSTPLHLLYFLLLVSDSEIALHRQSWIITGFSFCKWHLRSAPATTIQTS